MDREMKRVSVVLAAGWIAALGLGVAGLLTALVGGPDAVRLFMLVVLGLSAANVMLMLVIRAYTRQKCNLGIVAGSSMVLGCGLILFPGTSLPSTDWTVMDRDDPAQVVVEIPEDGERERVVQTGGAGLTPGGYGVLSRLD